MKKSNESFKELVKNIEVLQDDQQGKLKGGFSKSVTLSTAVSKATGNNCSCTNTVAHCGAVVAE